MSISDYRRVVTGLGEDGRSRILIDGPIPPSSPATGLAWHTGEIPADNSGGEDMGHAPFSFELMHSGASTFMVAEYPPGAGVGEPYWHATDTTDYIVVLKGEIVLELETGEVRLKAGDFVVDRGIVHSWRNDGPEVAASAIVTIPAKPAGKGRTV
jgi:mannose-6-phosphate isomerase-like protein (cupin superfamily)